MQEPTYIPSNIHIYNDEPNQIFTGNGITFYNFGKWICEIDGLPILPGGSLNESLTTQKIEHRYQIKFTVDLSAHPIVTNNPSLTHTKRLTCRLLKKS